MNSSQKDYNVNSQSGSKSMTVVLLIETSREFGRELLYGITKYSRLHGHWRFYRQPGGLEAPLPNVKNWNVDGAIVRDLRASKRLVSLEVPVIFAQHTKDTYYPYPTIITDSKQIGTIGAEHFIDRGFRNFAYCGYDDYLWSQKRAESFAKRVAKEGYFAHLYKQPVSRAKRTWKSEQVILAEWLKSLPQPVGVMACNDDRGVQILDACRLADLYVPHNIAVLGVDNDELACEMSDPPLSSITLNARGAGYQAAELLDRLMKGDENLKGQVVYVHPLQTVTRQSSDILASTDINVTTALRFIKDNANKPIQVDDVVNATTVSRRGIERRFKQILNRSVNQEIRRIRIEHIISLINETNLSVTEIALKTGFGGVEHIARYFRKETGLSIREYRKQFTTK